MAKPKTPWGSGVDTGAGSLDIVILALPKGHEFTIEDLEKEVRRRGLKTRRGIRDHLVDRCGKGFLVHPSSTTWKRVVGDDQAPTQVGSGVELQDAILSDSQTASATQIVAERHRSTMRQVATPDFSVTEGRDLLRQHRERERKPVLVKHKKHRVLADSGRLACEVCEFDFNVTYGSLGERFAECHHVVPLGQLAGERQSKLSDLAIVCANCHRMLHRRPWHTIDRLRDVVSGCRRGQDSITS